ncbi:MAG: NAD/NADP octopine/nopaline dehydrogenase family protein, partial [Tropicimonas sp.]|uniref:NAD/NADP octopine/nopaline dehydrogenase family protein n=1 Tax=Tropicimonas sp. TaxID=2067044 RepID=UPI003A8B85A9
MEVGHEVRLYSATFPGPQETHFHGAFKSRQSIAAVESLEEAAAFGEVLLMTRQAAGVRQAVDVIAGRLRPEQTVIFSAELSFTSLYLARLLRQAGRQAQIISWSTTVATAQRRPEGIRVGTLRSLIDMAAIGFPDAGVARQLCTELFGDRFRLVAHPAVIGLSNLNPQIHLANSIANLTRIERGEDWENYLCITPAVGRLIERLDIERLGLASSFGFKVRDVHEHYLMTFPDIAPGTVSDMAGQVGAGTKGPVTLQNRY